MEELSIQPDLHEVEIIPEKFQIEGQLINSYWQAIFIQTAEKEIPTDMKASPRSNRYKLPGDGPIIDIATALFEQGNTTSGDIFLEQIPDSNNREYCRDRALTQALWYLKLYNKITAGESIDFLTRDPGIAETLDKVYDMTKNI